MYTPLGVVYICNGIAMAVGGMYYHNFTSQHIQDANKLCLGFIGYGVGLHMDGVGGHGAWQWYVIGFLPETRRMYLC